MRSSSEINQAISYLKGKGNRIAKEQAKVLAKQMTESQVFEIYVANAGENKDEAVYFATREAAQYLSGKITIEELIPDHADITPVPVEDSNGISMSNEDFKALLARIDALESRVHQLESWTGKKRKAARREPAPMPIGFDKKDMLNQRSACTYLGVSKTTIKKYANMGLLRAYQYGRYVCYLKKEVDKLKNEKQDG
ncbi:MAG: helix-turn-helix domain-containing protein [Prevotella sp.]